MALRLIFVVAVVLVSGVISEDDRLKNCIKGKYDASLGDDFKDCFQTKRSLFAPRVKQCYQDIMIAERVVKVANNGQMTVNRSKFGDYARQNNHVVGNAMHHCYNTTTADDPMYQEAARASQCVFDKVKKGCN